VKHIDGVALRAVDRHFEILDQTRLPDAEVWVDGGDPAAMVGHIQRLSVRGAPLIGVAAALSVAAAAERGAGRAELHDAIDRLRRARPTAVNLAWAMDRLRAVLDAGGGSADLVREAEAIHEEDVAACERMGDLGADLVRPGEQLLTHCNAGALATAGIGSALGVIHRAHARGRGIHVWVNETRPLLQGARLTAWELGRLGVPYTIVTEGMDGALFRAGKVSRVIVGRTGWREMATSRTRSGPTRSRSWPGRTACRSTRSRRGRRWICSARRETPSPSSSGPRRRCTALAASGGPRPRRASSIPRSTSRRSRS
jgi:methylthioribose-1-phosphate isomerase